MPKKSVTIRDVAKQAGVTASTVSRILNKKSTTIPVTEATRQRVFEVARVLGYTPNRLARSLATSKTNVIGLYFPVTEPLDRLHHNEATWMGFGAMVSGVQQVTQERGYEAHIFNRLEYEDENAAWFRDVCPDFVDGLIYFEPNPRYDFYTRLADSGLPLVTVGPSPFSPPGYSVSADNHMELGSMVRALLAKGHKRIAYLLALVNEAPLDCLQRAEAYKVSHEASGLQFDSRLLPLEKVGDIPIPEQTKRLLALPDPPTAIILGRPEMAEEVLGALRDLGVRLPQDLQLLVVGDDPSFPYMNPSISAMRMDYFGLGYHAAKLVVDVIDGLEPTPKQVIVPWCYMRRESCNLGVDSLDSFRE